MAQAPRVRVWVKKQIRIDHLSFNQTQMLKLGTVGVANVKNRVQSAMGPEDSKAKPLNKRYAITKSTKLRKRAVRDLTVTGALLGNFQVRTVSENKAFASLTSRKQRDKGKALSGIEAWMVFSPTNVKQTVASARRIFTESLPHMILEKWLKRG